MIFHSFDQVTSAIDDKIASLSCDCMIANDPKLYHPTCRGEVSKINNLVQLKGQVQMAINFGANFDRWVIGTGTEVIAELKS